MYTNNMLMSETSHVGIQIYVVIMFELRKYGWLYYWFVFPWLLDVNCRGHHIRGQGSRLWWLTSQYPRSYACQSMGMECMLGKSKKPWTISRQNAPIVFSWAWSSKLTSTSANVIYRHRKMCRSKRRCIRRLDYCEGRQRTIQKTIGRLL